MRRRDAAVLYSNRARFGATHPSAPALGFLTRDRVLDACAAARRGRAVSLADEATRLRAAGPLERPIAARGVLLDVARMARRPWLPDGSVLGPTDLDDCAERQGVALEPGDALLVHTGFAEGCRRSGDAARLVLSDAAAGPKAAPGLAASCARWLFEREVAVLGADTPLIAAAGPDAEPWTADAVEHTGIVLATMTALDELARACAADGEWAFLFVCPPPDPGGRAQPVAVR